MAGRVEGRVALVTGGASGIGRSCAETLAAEGATVVVTDIQDHLGAEVVAAIAKAGGRADYISHDVTNEDAWIEVISRVKANHGRLDILVNNAGIGLSSPILEMSLADWKRQIAVNLDGVFLGVKHAIPLMRAGGRGGSIVNISSVAGLKGSPNLAGYCATKGGVRLFTKSVALECANAKDGIRVNSVHPGIIETPIWLTVMPTGTNEPPNLDDLSAMAVPLGVKGVPQDIANGVVWLCSDEARYVTGLELVIDGGLTLR